MRKIISILLCFLLFCNYSFAGITINGVNATGINIFGDNTWYRKQITITGSADSALSNYPVMIKVHHGPGTDSGTDVYLNSKAKSDFSDVRFTSSNGTTALSYWKESYTPADVAIFWVKIPSISVSPALTKIYIYYNNASKDDIGDGDNVFTSFVDKDDVESFVTDPRWITVSRPYKLDPSINRNFTSGSSTQAYGNPSSVKLSTGNYLTHYHKFNGLIYDNGGTVEGQESIDKGKNWINRQTIYDDPTPYNAEIAGLFEKDNGNVVALIKLIDRNVEPNTLIGIKYAESTDGGATWPDEASWLTAYGPTDYIHGIPNDWTKIGDSWYAMSENLDASDNAYSQLLKFDGTTFSTVSRTPVTPDQTTEAAVTSMGGDNLMVIQRHRNTGSGYLDASTKTIKVTSSNMGINWSDQTDIADAVGIIQDPNLAWTSGSPGDGTLMLFGRQGPNIGTSPDLTQQDNVAWFSYDNGLTWKNKTLLWTNTQTVAQTVGGYLTAIIEDSFINFIGWTDSFGSTYPTVANKRMYKNILENFILLCAYAQSNDNLAHIPFTNGSLTRYQLEIKALSYSTPNTDITSFIFTDGVGSGNKVFQGYIPRTTGTDVGYLNGATSSSAALYSGFVFGTKYILTADVNTASTGTELVSIKALSADRVTTLASTTNKKFSLGSPTQITHLEIGPDINSGRSSSRIDFVFLRKKTTNEPTITAYGTEETTTSYPT